MKIAARGASLSVRVKGDGDYPVLLLLHAFPLHSEMWAPQIDGLSRGFRVVAPDFRGFGGSDVDDGQYAIDFFVDDLFALLDSPKLGVPHPIAACGLSMGGYVLLRAVEREPQRFGALVLADTRSGADDDAGRLKRLDAVRKLKQEGASAYAEAFVQNAVGATTHARRPEVVERVRAMVRSNSVLGMVGGQLAMAARTDTTPVLTRIGAPTLVVVGEEDGLTPLSASQAMADEIPGARLEVLPGVGHLSALEDPGAFNRVLDDFLHPGLLNA